MPTVISEKLEFAFIHVPKNGGTTIGRQLQDQLEHDPRFVKPSVLRDPDGGETFFDHLTMKMYQSTFPDVLERLTSYNTIAVCREPLARFRSALSQFARNTLQSELWQLSKADLISLVRAALSNMRGPERNTLDMVFFRPQHEFLELDGRQIVKSIFPMERLDDLADYVTQNTGAVLDLKSEDRKTLTVDRNKVKALQPLKALVKATVPERVYYKLRKTALEATKTNGDDCLSSILHAERAAEQISEYYERDFEIYKAACSKSTTIPRHLGVAGS